MGMAPEEIEKQTFATDLFGYCKREVDAFVAKVASNYRPAYEAKRQAADPYGSLAEKVNAVLMSAKQLSESVRARAEEEAAHEVEAGRREVGALRAAAERECAEMIERATERYQEIEAHAQEVAARIAAAEEALARLKSLVAAGPQDDGRWLSRAQAELEAADVN
jgi:DivIVA domain-containing protein